MSNIYHMPITLKTRKSNLHVTKKHHQKTKRKPRVVEVRHKVPKRNLLLTNNRVQSGVLGPVATEYSPDELRLRIDQEISSLAVSAQQFHWSNYCGYYENGLDSMVPYLQLSMLLNS